MFLVGALIALAGGMGVYELHFRTDHHSTPIGLDAALDEFQASASSSLPAGAPSTELPAPGVYSYSTTGNDGVDALGGALHRYPATSTIIVTAADCGVSQRWVPLEQRADETVTCATVGGVELYRFTAFHQFFGQDEREEWECTGEPRPLDAAPGTTWTTQCTKQRGTNDVGSVDTWSGVVVGPETATVDGETVDVDHVTVSIATDDPRDVQVTDTWYLAGTDLVMRRVVNNSTTTGSPVGDVHYLEHVELTLESLTPAR